MTEKLYRIAVVGGGVGGPVAAACLRSLGHEVTLFETRRSDAHDGAMLTLAPNGIAALTAAGLESALEGLGQPLHRTVMADARGRELVAFGGLAGLPPSRALWRADLAGRLRHVATSRGVEVRCGQTVLDIHRHQDAVELICQDSTHHEADFVVAADGIHSRIRRMVDPNAPAPTHVPLLNVGGVASSDIDAEPGTSYFVYGRRMFLGYWREPDERIAWFVNIPEPAPMTGREARSVPAGGWLEKILALAAHEWPAAQLVRDSQEHDVSPLGSIEILPHVARWHDDRVVLIGDAACSPSPSSGQGASLAIESGVELARCVRDCDGPATAFRAFDSLRRQRVETVAKRAMRTNSTKTYGPAAIAALRLAMPVALRTILTPERLLGFEQRHVINWSAPVVAGC